MNDIHPISINECILSSKATSPPLAPSLLSPHVHSDMPIRASRTSLQGQDASRTNKAGSCPSHPGPAPLPLASTASLLTAKAPAPRESLRAARLLYTSGPIPARASNASLLGLVFATWTWAILTTRLPDNGEEVRDGFQCDPNSDLEVALSRGETRSCIELRAKNWLLSLPR